MGNGMGNLVLRRGVGEALIFQDATGRVLGTLRVGEFEGGRVKVLCNFAPDIAIVREELTPPAWAMQEVRQ